MEKKAVRNVLTVRCCQKYFNNSFQYLSGKVHSWPWKYIVSCNMITFGEEMCSRSQINLRDGPGAIALNPESLKLTSISFFFLEESDGEEMWGGWRAAKGPGPDSSPGPLQWGMHSTHWATRAPTNQNFPTLPHVCWLFCDDLTPPRQQNTTFKVPRPFDWWRTYQRMPMTSLVSWRTFFIPLALLHGKI